MASLCGAAEQDAHKYGREAVLQVSNAQFHSHPGLDDVGAGSATELLMPQVLSFLADVSEMGRHFRVSAGARVVVGQNKEGDRHLLRLARRSDCF